MFAAKLSVIEAGLTNHWTLAILVAFVASDPSAKILILGVLGFRVLKNKNNRGCHLLYFVFDLFPDSFDIIALRTASDNVLGWSRFSSI